MAQPLLNNLHLVTDVNDSNFTFTFITQIDSDQDHYHHCYKVIVSLDFNFDCLIDGQLLKGVRGLIVNQAVPHSLLAEETEVLVILVKSESFYGIQLKQLLGNQACLDLNSVMHPNQFTRVFPSDYKNLSDNLLTPIARSFFRSIIFNKDSETIPRADERIKRAIQYIELNLHERLLIRDIAIEINLSRHRTRHLFSFETSVPFSQFILWRRLTKTLTAVVKDDSRFTDASLRYGFSDQAHFNHTFKQIFSFRPKDLTQRCRLLL